MFLTVMVIGLVGLLVMALPAFSRHAAVGRFGHAAHGAMHAGHGLRGAHGAHAAALHAKAAAAGAATAPAAAPSAGVTRFLPSPRMVFSLLALYGAFGNALVRAAHLTTWVAALVAVVPAALVERFAVTPLWNLVFRFDGTPSSPLEELVLADATAVTAFRNGRGIVSLVRDGRLVQFPARLTDAHAGMQVRVGDRLRVEDLDTHRERRLIVSVRQD